MWEGILCGESALYWIKYADNKKKKHRDFYPNSTTCQL